MTSGDGLLNKQQRKKVRRKDRKQREREAHRNLDTITGEAIEASLMLAPDVARTRQTGVIDVELASLSEAQFVRKRINDALNIAEWLDDVRVVLWNTDEQISAPLSEQGEAHGFELQIEFARRD